jgi:hypothetical protein
VKKYLPLTTCLLLLTLAACSPSLESPIPPSFTPTTPPTAAPTAAATLPPEPTLTATAGSSPEDTPEVLPDITYQIDAVYDYAEHLVEVQQRLLIPHPGVEPLQEIVLAAPPNAWRAVFNLSEARWGDGRPISNLQLDGVRLTLPLEQPWQPGTTRSLELDYTLDMPVQNAREGYGPSPFGFTELQVNLVDWYPLVPPYEPGRGWIVHDPWIFGEYLVYPAADFQVNLQVLDAPPLTAAASAEESGGGSVRSYQLEDARNFVLSLSPQYRVLEEQIGATTVSGYYFPGYQASAEAAFQTTVDALELYNTLYGPYTQSSLAMVQADFNHGMEYEGLYFQSRGFFDTYNGTEKNFLTIIAAHETAHQWWYGQVANDQALEPWLDEALCTFSELVYYENLYPEAVDWWWAARVEYYQPEGPIDGSIYDYQGIQDQYLAYRDATYLQGAKFLVDLRDSLGEAQFYTFLQDYLARHEGEIASEEDFFNLLDEYVGLETLDWLGEYFPDRAP